MYYEETERTLDALKSAVIAAGDAKAEGDMPEMYSKAVSDINIEFERLRELLGY